MKTSDQLIDEVVNGCDTKEALDPNFMRNRGET
jgi:hypothetical protein